MKIATIIFVGLQDWRNKLYCFRWLVGPMKIRCTVLSARWPTNIDVFSSVADENIFIFIDFIPWVYFCRSTDENTYFWRLSGYFRRFIADEITLFSSSVSSPLPHLRPQTGCSLFPSCISHLRPSPPAALVAGFWPVVAVPLCKGPNCFDFNLFEKLSVNLRDSSVNQEQ
jgi:hypothetical protein